MAGVFPITDAGSKEPLPILKKRQHRLRPKQNDSYNGHMEKATVSKLKDNLSAYLRKVRAGHTVVIYDRNVPIACIERIESSERGADRLALLRAQGLTRPAKRALSVKRLRTMLGKGLPRNARLGEALREERDAGR
jgi:antitoxin (DNA-binding transcriptional repressor) of toxin-antitoxin stability system